MTSLKLGDILNQTWFMSRQLSTMTHVITHFGYIDSLKVLRLAIRPKHFELPSYNHWIPRLMPNVPWSAETGISCTSLVSASTTLTPILRSISFTYHDSERMTGQRNTNDHVLTSKNHADVALPRVLMDHYDGKYPTWRHIPDYVLLKF